MVTLLNPYYIRHQKKRFETNIIIWTLGQVRMGLWQWHSCHFYCQLDALLVRHGGVMSHLRILCHPRPSPRLADTGRVRN